VASLRGCHGVFSLRGLCICASGDAAIALGALNKHPNTPICAIIKFKQGTEDFIPPCTQEPNEVQSIKVYLSQGHSWFLSTCLATDKRFSLGIMNRIGDSLFHSKANEPLVQALVAAGVKFVVIGGLAVSWYCPTRQADDMDLLIEPTVENSTRIANLLARLGNTGFGSEAFAKLGLQVPLKVQFYAELLTPQLGTATFREIEATAVDAKLFSIPVRLASVAVLVQMKKHAAASAAEQQAKHLNDIALLEQHAA
jgi:hypothetical protein